MRTNDITAPATNPWAWIGFVAPAAAIYAFEVALATRLHAFDRPGALAVAVLLDLAVVVPALFWWVLVRPGRAPVIALVPVTVVGVLVAGALLPPAHRGAVDAAHLVLVPAELALVGWIAWRASRLVRTARERAGGGLDFLEAMQAAAARVLGAGRVAKVVGYEGGVIGYALGLAPRGDAGPQDSRFSHHRESAYGAVVAAVAIVGVVEIVAVHVLLSRWSAAAAWIVTALSLYAFVWIVGDLRAARRRRSTFDGDLLTLRIGLRWTVEVPLDAIDRVERIATAGTVGGKPRPLSAVLVGAPALRLHLTRDVAAHGPYGIVRRVRTIDLAVDGPDRLRQALEARLGDRP